MTVELDSAVGTLVLCVRLEPLPGLETRRVLECEAGSEGGPAHVRVFTKDAVGSQLSELERDLGLVLLLVKLLSGSSVRLQSPEVVPGGDDPVFVPVGLRDILKEGVIAILDVVVARCWGWRDLSLSLKNIKKIFHPTIQSN